MGSSGGPSGLRDVDGDRVEDVQRALHRLLVRRRPQLQAHRDGDQRSSDHVEDVRRVHAVTCIACWYVAGSGMADLVVSDSRPPR